MTNFGDFSLSLTADWSKIKCQMWSHHFHPTQNFTEHVQCGWHHNIRTQTSLDTTVQILFHAWEDHKKEKHADA